MKKNAIKTILTVLVPVCILIMVTIFACVTQSGKGKEPVQDTKRSVTNENMKGIDLDYDPNRLVFLLIGQSNMEGVPKPEAVDMEENPRIFVLAYQNSPRQKRLYDQWYIATPPLHSSSLGVGIGDYFAKTLIKGLSEKYSIALVPCGISGVDIDFFRKGVVSKRRKEFRIPPDNHWDGAYEWVIERARLAQKAGRIAGIVFHQGESDAGQSVWLDKVDEMVTNLRNDLETGDIPFVAGELYYKGPCAGHNRIIQRVPDRISNSRVVSAEGLNGVDQFHFDLEGQREIGKRYGEAMLELLDLGK
ncbi:MAG: hypothetical protein JW881_07930 [Spirochaetales bacterium]|nr:hypothetical protein [Spirochaetales bacterium]